MKIRTTTEAIDRHRFPIDPWRLIETEPDHSDLGVTETLFATGNGYMGMRANYSETREAHTHGTYVNGFHETWPIVYPETAHAFATTGQTIVNAPDAKPMLLTVDDQPLQLDEAGLDAYERTLDLRDGYQHLDMIWSTQTGDRVQVTSRRLVSLAHRHLAVLTLEITALDGPARIGVSSQMLNRQDRKQPNDPTTADDPNSIEGPDPRQASRFAERVLVPQGQRHLADLGAGGEVTLGYRCAHSGMTLACAYRHEIDSECPLLLETIVDDDQATTEFSIAATQGSTIRITKFIAYHASRSVPSDELADRCAATIAAACAAGVAEIEARQRGWLDTFWARSDVVIDGDDQAQQAIRWNLFQLAQATAQTGDRGVAAKGVTGGGYDGHYFWDTDVYVVPFLAYTTPEAAHQLLLFRSHMLDAARTRAVALSQCGALFPWRTISGEEASAYYPAGTAQYHINAAVVYGLSTFVHATGDLGLLANEGAEILVETARFWEDLGFYRKDRASGTERFHIHGVTGPDEYTAVVNDNTYTNLMAQFNLRYAARTVEWLEHTDAAAYRRLHAATALTEDEPAAWNRAADAMFIPYDDQLGINPQDAAFLDLEPWDFAATPQQSYPLLLHYHPLVIYRHQVLKQADVVLAMFLRGTDLPDDLKRRNFDFYDPITTGDSSLSACVQSIVASEIGHHDLAIRYFKQSAYLDLADTHGNTADGVHIANAGGVWAALVYGFAGMSDDGEQLSFDPHLPAQWTSIRFRLAYHGSSLEVAVDHSGCDVRWIAGPPIPVRTPSGVVPVDGNAMLRFHTDGPA
jgi:alpha,alpha-trehalose phosphorylase